MEKFLQKRDGTLIANIQNLKCWECTYKNKIDTNIFKCTFGICPNDDNNCNHFIMSQYFKSKKDEKKTNDDIEMLAKQGIYPKYPINTIVYLAEYKENIYEAVVTKINAHFYYNEVGEKIFSHFSYNLDYCMSKGKLVRAEKTLFESKELAYQALIEREVKAIQGALNHLKWIADINNLQLNIKDSVIPLISHIQEKDDME